jgi:hypothetical protein
MAAGPSLTGVSTRSQARVGSESTARVPREVGEFMGAMHRDCRLREKQDQTKYIWLGKRRMVPSMPQSCVSTPAYEKLSQGVAPPGELSVRIHTEMTRGI